MEQLTTVWVEFSKVLKIEKDGSEGNGSYGLYVFNETHSEHVFGMTWEELQGMTEKDIYVELIQLKDKYLHDCVVRRNGFYFNEQWISLDDVK
ncbi:hypothetical protein [Brevibacillus porteri]|uniref:hypothetical protein n=1 Tax=Brevibacillus porteri TaxID=2126350 RepID=UPI003D1A969B